MSTFTNPRSRAARVIAPLAAAASVALLAACATTANAGSDDASAGQDAAASGFPVTIDNCGTEVTFDAAPERVVTIKSSTLELLLALGLEDRVVGAAFTDGPVPDEFADAAAGIEILSDKVPSQEATLAAEPDLVFAGWESNLSAEGAGDRATLEQLGVHTYVAPAACKAEGYMPDPLTFDGVFAGFEEAGEIFGATDAAADLVAEQRAALEAIEPSDDGLTALWYSSGDDQPFVGAGIGAPQMIMEAAGLANVAADVHDTWTSLSWEAVVDANPDVIVLVDAAWNTAEAKIEKLEANPATAAMPAVQQGRYVIVDFPSTEAGVRNVDAVASIVEQLGAL
ncbi:ABC transporter substrate-binding protein [Agromyces luteolus]|uniref:Putative F420-0 ABC transporter substrate-binding protein n=1 Tax=Agromyces luteolus TaxID=88373 RepID=A0A7C9LWK6_9MICO|nr:putative F420-0 ABC transporter substrate-binding protein [Agromyces luteolus]MUN06277.1 putative F420-0 ABC transporter substrate-binding protein [Agromyces luteolus]GLK26691.1 ABC transporter substrate-binding protein [Agromyces luteolus]